MIQIDDSGIGSLLGGVYIGLYDTDTETLYAKPIPVSYFQGEKFAKQDYIRKALDIVKNGLIALNIDYKDNPVDVQCCRGFALTEIRKWLLTQQERTWCREVSFVKIKDPLQSLLEAKLSKYLGRYGVPNKSGSGGHRMSFNDMLEWVKEDLTRIKYVKTGWPAWKEKYSKECS